MLAAATLEWAYDWLEPRVGKLAAWLLTFALGVSIVIGCVLLIIRIAHH